MSELISGKEAKLAWANGVELEFYSEDLDVWFGLNEEPFMSDVFDTRKVRIKPKTIMINGIEVPAPFDPKEGEECWTLSTRRRDGYGWVNYSQDEPSVRFGTWRTEAEVEQVASAIRKIFVINNQ